VDPRTGGRGSTCQALALLAQSGYFAGRNATWIMKATPAIGWNE
jgi:hypothetical protein